MVQLTPEKILSRKIDLKEPHHKPNKNFSKIVKKKKKKKKELYQPGHKTFCNHFSLTKLFWFQ